MQYHINGYGGQVIAKIDNNGNTSKELLFDTRDDGSHGMIQII